MTALPVSPHSPRQLGSRSEAQGYVEMVCFKHGPPRLHGMELEWTVHQAGDPSNPLDIDQLRAALGPYAPRTAGHDPNRSSPHRSRTAAPHADPIPLDAGSLVTLEPGGQVEISAPPTESVATLISTVERDSRQLRILLEAAGLELGESGLDPYRPPRRILDLPRYAAMQTFFDQLGPRGSEMMCSSAGLQICLDAGEEADVAPRWRAAHSLGPVMVALFANSSRQAGRETGWASARLRSTLGTCPPFTSPPGLPDLSGDPAVGWARLAMEAPVICIRREHGSWQAPAGLTFGAWADGAVGERPTEDDLDYHLSTLFPPVRPRGYLEIRYLDAQRGSEWLAPSALLMALMSDRAIVDQALALTEPTADRWWTAAREGLDDALLSETADRVVALGLGALDRLDLDAARNEQVIREVECRLADQTLERCEA